MAGFEIGSALICGPDLALGLRNWARWEAPPMKIWITLVATVVLAAFTVQAADAGKKDSPNFGYCKNGKKVKDVTRCGENRGRGRR